MATEQGIRTHNELLNRIADGFDSGLAPLFNDLFAELANLGVTQDRTAIQRLFAPLQGYLLAQVTQLDSVAQSIVDTNSDVIQQPIDNATLTAVEAVKTTIRADVSTVIETEQNRIIGIIVLAAIAGALASNLIAQTRSELAKSRARISTAFTTGVFQFNTVVTRLRAQISGIKRYRYVGGTIATSREFCTRHNNKVYTEQEIRSIWRQSWGGKAPGDPMVVRGGYNCRHWWVPVE